MCKTISVFFVGIKVDLKLLDEIISGSKITDIVIITVIDIKANSTLGDL
jgi:hypothetical protein